MSDVSYLRSGTPIDLASIARELHRALESPNSAKLVKAIEAGNWDEVVGIRANPLDYTSALAYYLDVLPTLFKKVEDLPLTADRAAVTLKKWWDAEHACYRSNQRLFPFLPGKIHYSQVDQGVSRHLAGIRKIIRGWIGRGPGAEALGFSPGSTLTDRGYRSTVAHKLHKAPSATIQYENAGFPEFIGTLWHHNMVDAGLTPFMVRGGEYFTVPKNSQEDRPAEMQPSLNISAQLGAGQELRRRLRRSTGLTLMGRDQTLSVGVGWDLEKAQDIHREVARRASVDRSFCTIDLTSASDMVSRVLVELLFPTLWYRHLDGLRTHYIKLGNAVEAPPVANPDPANADEAPQSKDRGYILMEKFSSMGNGFTFELETIIFAAVACYVSRINGYWGELGFDVFVFGDDIIVRDELYSDVSALLMFLGFKLNQGKSFHGQHPFRESCGGDYFNGVNVRPFYLKGKVSELTHQTTVSFINQIKRASTQLSEINSNYSLNRLWFTCLSHLPRWIRDCRGPEWFGDSVVQDPCEGAWTVRYEVRSRPMLRAEGCDKTTWSLKRTGHMRVTTMMIKTISWQPGLDQYVSWSHFDPATILACAVLGRGDGLKGLLPRKPLLTPVEHWAVLGCPGTGEA